MSSIVENWRLLDEDEERAAIMSVEMEAEANAKAKLHSTAAAPAPEEAEELPFSDLPTPERDLCQGKICTPV